MGDGTVSADEITSEKGSRPCSPELHVHKERFSGRGPSTSARFRVCAGPDGVGVPPCDRIRLLPDRQREDLEKLGGVDGLVKLLHTDTEYGLDETEEQMHKRREAYGSKTYPKKMKKGFWFFIWDACKDTTLNILMVCADVSLATEIWTEGIKEGWYEGTSIGVAVLLVIVITAASDYKQGLNFQNLNADKSLVRVLAPCETMRSATTICSVKTGTLTTNKMTVTGACVGGEMKGEDSLGPESLPEDSRKFLVQSICLNKNGNVSLPKEGEEPAVTGSPTEAVLLTWGTKLGKNSRDPACAKTLNSEKKRAGVVSKTSDGEVQLHWKGGAESILDLCTYYIDSCGELQPMTVEKRNEFSGLVEGMAPEALRCIAFAYRSFDEAEIQQSEDARSEWKVPDQELILMAIAGIKDPFRPGVREAVLKCQRAGVKVRMVTGENIYTADDTAAERAAECGVLIEGGLVVEAKDFRTGDDAKLNRKALDNLVVMARSSPLDKLKLVKVLKERRGDVVAVSGDGTDDVPALKEADIAGTEVAKESSDIIILDDNYTSVVQVVRWGRSVYANIRKFIQFQLTVNVVALTINFVAAVTSGEVPVTYVQLLWVNLIMATVGALALATEAPAHDLINQSDTAPEILSRSAFADQPLKHAAQLQLQVLRTIQFASCLDHWRSLRPIVTDKSRRAKLFLLCSFGFMLTGVRAEDQIEDTRSGKPDPTNFWNIRNLVAATVTLLVGLMMIRACWIDRQPQGPARGPGGPAGGPGGPGAPPGPPAPQYRPAQDRIMEVLKNSEMPTKKNKMFEIRPRI